MVRAVQHMVRAVQCDMVRAVQCGVYGCIVTVHVSQSGLEA